MTYLQAVVIALVQGVTELFPVSSLGHSVLLPAWIGGSWQTLVTQSSRQSSESSFCLAYIVALHGATALALMWFFRADWIRIIRGFFRSLPASARLTLATVPLPAGAVSQPASHREQASGREAADIDAAARSGARLARLSYGNAIVIGSTQILALLAGISRSGITMAGGLWRGLDHEDAARFAFLLATPVILAAGVLKVPSLPFPGRDWEAGFLAARRAVPACGHTAGLAGNVADCAGRLRLRL